jgi:hypothetical protein
MAEDLTEGVSGVRDVHNQLRVVPGGQERQQPSEPQSRPGETPRHRAA